MKKLTLLFLTVFFYAFSLSAQNIMVPVQLMNEISTKKMGKNTITPSVIVASDVIYQGEVYIKQGALVNAQAEITPRGAIGKPGKISLKVMSTVDVNGNIVVLSGCDVDREGKSKMGKSIGLSIGLGLFVIPPFGLFFLCMKGEDTTIPSGTVVTCTGIVNK